MRLCIQLPDGPFLKGANLPDRDLSNAEAAYEKGTALWKRGADLSHADLSGHVTEKQLARANDLKDLTVTNDQKYEDWLKSKGRGRMERTAPLAYEAGRGRMITRRAPGPEGLHPKGPCATAKDTTYYTSNAEPISKGNIEIVCRVG